MKPGSRLIQNIHRLSGITLGQFRSQFHTLALSARQGGGRLFDVLFVFDADDVFSVVFAVVFFSDALSVFSSEAAAYNAFSFSNTF